jgi:hypothetical protein
VAEFSHSREVATVQRRLYLGFNIKDIMILTALEAFYVAPDSVLFRRSGDPISYVYLFCQIITLAIYIYNRRLSKWMWLVIASGLSQPFFNIVDRSGIVALLTQNSEGWRWKLLVQSLAEWFLFTVGLGMTFRAIRLRMASVAAVDPRPPSSQGG